MILDRSVYESIYNSYKDFFNNADSKVSAYSELVTIKDGLKKRVDELEGQVKEQATFFESDLTQMIIGEANIGTPSKTEQEKEKSLRKGLRKLSDQIIRKLKYHLATFSYVKKSHNKTNTNDELTALVQIKREIEKFCKMRGNEQRKHKFISDIEYMKWLQEKILPRNHHIRAIESISDKIIIGNHLIPKLKSEDQELREFDELTEDQKDKELTLVGDVYQPHPNVTEGLVDDLRKIVNEVKTKSRFFHNDGRIKHVSVSEYAVNQQWFSKKYNHPSSRGLNDHIKKIYNLEFKEDIVGEE